MTNFQSYKSWHDDVINSVQNSESVANRSKSYYPNLVTTALTERELSRLPQVMRSFIDEFIISLHISLNLIGALYVHCCPSLLGITLVERES